MDTAPSRDVSRPPRRLLGDPPAMAVLLAALLVATFSYVQFRRHAQQLWNNPLHDRNAHYWMSLSIGLDLRQGNLAHLMRDLDKTRIWGPLYPLLTGAVLALGGLDYRLAVLTSLAAWSLTVLFAFLIARRAAPRGGTVAGCFAALFLLSSPAHQAFAQDIMLESLGACLSLMAVYFYLVLVQEERPKSACGLALSLTALFLLKYNYWLLLILSLVLVEVSTRRAIYAQLVLQGLRGIREAFHLQSELRNPLNWAIGLFLGLAAWIVLTGGCVLNVAGQAISIRSPDNALWLAFVLSFLRGLQWWVCRGRAAIATLDPRAQPFFWLHLLPALLWMLWPKRLSHFLSYLTRNHGEGEASGGLLNGISYYLGALASHYHQHLLLFLAVLILAGVGLLCCRRLTRGSGLIVSLTLVAGLLTFTHPTCRSRFLHSWIGILWVLAGVGFSAVLVLGERRRSLLRRSLGGGVVLVLACWQVPGLGRPAHVPEGGIDGSSPSSLQLTEQYLDELAGSDRVAILSNQPVKFFSWWTYLQRYQRLDRVEPDLQRLGVPPEESPAAIESWLTRTRFDTIVLLQFDPHSRHAAHEPDEQHEQIRRCLRQQSVFLPVKQLRVAEHDCEIIILRRQGSRQADGQ